MSSGKNYIPNNDHDFLAWLEKLLAFASINCGRWYIANPEGFLSPLWEDFKAKLLKASDPNCGKVDLFAAKEARRKTEKEARNFVQGFLARNQFVTSEDRVAMQLPLYDTEPTTVADPVGLAKANVKYPNKGALELQLEHDGSTPADAKANYGFRIYHGVVAAGETPPASGMDLHESIFSRKKKVLFTYKPDDSGKTAYFCIRYENSKGKAGQWGALFSAIIP